MGPLADKAKSASTVVRIQRRRRRGWRAPRGAIYVGRPTRWGNPYETAREYREHVLPGLSSEDLEPLRGKTLMCWCPLDANCHADALLEAANRRNR